MLPRDLDSANALPAFPCLLRPMDESAYAGPSPSRPDLRLDDCLRAVTRLGNAAVRKQERGQVASGLHHQ